MFLICEQKDLLNAARLTAQAVNLSNSLPVLNNILLKAENGKLKFTATNLEISITTDIPAQIRNEGTLTVPARLFSSYVQFLKPGKVELQKSDGQNLKISTLSQSSKQKTDSTKNPAIKLALPEKPQTQPQLQSQSQIKGISADEFPLIPQVKGEFSFTVMSKDLFAALNQVAFTAAKDLTRPILAGVVFQITKNEIRLAATDSFRLAEKILKPSAPLARIAEFIIPVRTANELIHILDKENTKVKIDLTANQALFLYKNIEFASRLVEGKYPDYTKIIPNEHITVLKLQKEDLINAVKRVNLFAKDLHAVKLTIDADKKLRIFSEQTQMGGETTEVAAVVEGAENAIALNANYLLEALAVLEGNEIKIELGPKMKPAILRSPKQPEYLHLIMPLKI